MDWYPGYKLPLTGVILVEAAMRPSFYGNCAQFCKFEDDVGNSYTWWNTSENTLDKSKSYFIIGNIKRHEEYLGRKNTRLTHVKAYQKKE